MNSSALIRSSFFDYSPTTSTTNAENSEAPTQITLGLWVINSGTENCHIIKASSDDSVETFKENVARQLNVKFNQLAIYHSGLPLKDEGKNLGSYGFGVNTKLLATLAVS